MVNPAYLLVDHLFVVNISFGFFVFISYLHFLHSWKPQAGRQGGRVCLSVWLPVQGEGKGSQVVCKCFRLLCLFLLFVFTTFAVVVVACCGFYLPVSIHKLRQICGSECLYFHDLPFSSPWRRGVGGVVTSLVCAYSCPQHK